MADPLAVGLAAVIGICVALVICIIALIIFVIVFCNLKLKDDTNIRKRLLANDVLDEEKQTMYREPPTPVVLPPPVVVPPPMPPPQPVLPRVQPALPPIPRPRPQQIRRRSWGGEDDWILVKKTTTKPKRRSRDSDSDSDSDSDDGGHCHRRYRSGCNPAPAVIPMMPSLAAYDLATPTVIPRAAPAATVTPVIMQPVTYM